jgi:hypothetical protein
MKRAIPQGGTRFRPAASPIFSSGNGKRGIAERKNSAHDIRIGRPLGRYHSK